MRSERLPRRSGPSGSLRREALSPEEEIRYRAQRSYAPNFWEAYLLGARSGTIRSELDPVLSARLRFGFSGDSPMAVEDRDLWEKTRAY